MFCMETAATALYWALLVYDVNEASLSSVRQEFYGMESCYNLWKFFFVTHYCQQYKGVL